ncbi:transcriptional regulator [Lentzea sp. PSKA42]|uniref:Transcriptional regulator n=1 Tax=Lentzea indica TaxID=2604800 RepID=A0ABX1FAD7_9PSEU|nr:transcriptional regulator [Lentzea indica]NKE55860.1 transcriptional regulator [Lentzea indica]
MYLADGGGSSSPPEFGQRKLKVEPHAIPQTRAAFEHALDEFDAKITPVADDLPTRPWAGDPISSETSKAFNEQTSGKALAALKTYRQQLVGVIDQLKMIEEQYRQTEGDNEAMWGKHLRDRD